MGRLDGKFAIVLGAAAERNIGTQIARRFAQEGAKVVVSGRKEAPLKKLAEEIGGSYRLCDITRKAEVDALVDFTRQRYGHVDIGVNATGWGFLKEFADTTEEEMDQILALQFKGPFFFMQALVKAMDRGGSIMMISSATATIMLENHAAYMGTKAAIDHIARCCANEYGAKGIKVNSISPGITLTPMTADATKVPGLLDVFTKEYPLGRIGTDEDIANAALWLASDESFMTGQNLQVNGGLTLRRNPTRAEMAEFAMRAMKAAQ